ncbi:MAG: hypothetical protein JWP87_1457 [Labilithrix sp.]|nr:hypothetical protein [Labilithrix sp.]
MTNVRTLLGLSIVVASVLAPLRASADVQACLAASEKGQRGRAAGKLREARDQFLFCGSEGCPAMVRRDCAQWQGEVIGMLPSVVFGAKDKGGRDLFDVTVSMDGETLVRKLDGKSVAVDPGPHTFKFESAGAAPAIERALVKEGEKTRVITVTFPDVGTAVVAEGPHGEGGDRGRQTAGTSEGGHTVFPWIVVGVGVATVAAGVIVIATSPAFPAGCIQATQTCRRADNESDSDFAKRQKDAARAEGQPIEGLIIGAVGLGVAAGGLLWHFLEPTGSERTGALRFTPWAGPASAGGMVGASF